MDVFSNNTEGKRIRKQLEVDFVVNCGSQRYYIQVAYDITSKEKQIQEFQSLRDFKTLEKRRGVCDYGNEVFPAESEQSGILISKKKSIGCVKRLSRRPGYRKILPGPDVICFLYKLFKLTVIQRRIRAIFGE